MAYPEKAYSNFQKAKTLSNYGVDNTDHILTKQEDGRLGYVSVSELKSFRRNYGDFYDTTTQSGSANTNYAVKLNSTNIASNVSIVSGSRITPTNTGVYNLQFSLQLANTTNSDIAFDVWLAYTGSNVDWSNTQIDVTKTAGQLGRHVAAWNLVKEIQSGDYVELMWRCNGSTGRLETSGSNAVPAVPSAIVTLTQIA